MPRARDRLRLRHGPRDGYGSAERHGESLSAPHRSGKYREAQIVRGHDRGRDDRRLRTGNRCAAEMAERLLFLTGHLAEPRLVETIRGIGLEEGSWHVRNIGI